MVGSREDAEKYSMNDPAVVFVPKGLTHNAWIVTKMTDPKHPLMIICVSLANNYSLESDAVKYHPYPPAFNSRLIGAPQLSKGKYAEYVNRLLLPQDIYISFQLGCVCTPNLIQDVGHATPPGLGHGVPALAYRPARYAELG